MDIGPLSDRICKCLFPFGRQTFHFFVSFAVLFSFICSHLFIFAFGVIHTHKKTICHNFVEKLFTYIFYKSFMVSVFMFKSWTSQLVFVSGVRNTIYWRALLLNSSYLYCEDLFLGSRFWSILFMSVPYCFAFYSFIIWLWNQESDTSSFVPLSQDCSGYLRSFMVPYNF